MIQLKFPKIRLFSAHLFVSDMIEEVKIILFILVF